MYDEMQQQLDDEAAERAKRMQEKIADQLAEGGWDEALDEVIHDICTYPICVLKGPVIKRKQRLKWVDGEAQAVIDEVPSWERVDPQDFFPAPNIRKVNEGYVCEHIRMDKAELSRLRDAEGYSADEIDAVLSESDIAGQASQETSGEPERAALEGRDMGINAGLPEGTLGGVEFWGAVQGKLLDEWGMEVEDTNEFYHITAILIGNHVIKAIANPDTLGENPYHVASFEKISGDLWGKAIAEKMTDCQDACNACMRNTLSNLALASGPQVAVDLDALSGKMDPTLMYSWKVWQYHGTQSHGSGQPVTFFQPDSNADELLRVSEYFENKADDRTLIPRYSHGNAEVAGAGETASGLDMLMQAAAKGIKRVIGYLDKYTVRPSIERQWRWNLVYLPPEELEPMKGDIRVIPRGVLGALVREETQKRRQEFLQATQNDTDMQIIGIEGRANVLRAVAEDLDMDVDKIVPDEDKLQAMLQARQQAEGEGQEAGVGPGGETAQPAQAAGT